MGAQKLANTYILVDFANLCARARFAQRGNLDDQVGMSFHTCLSSIRKAWRDFDGTHVVFFLEGRSWRKDYYPPYKKNREALRNKQTPREQEEETVFWEAVGQFTEFLKEKTNATVIRHPKLEADDLISAWVQAHADDKHIIISTDGDFLQLVSDNVTQYNGVSLVTTTVDGFFDEDGKPTIVKKTGLPKPKPDIEWELFEHAMRGDAGDNVFSAYPGVRTKGSSKKVGLREAFDDRNVRGYEWNNIMNQTWTDHDGNQHRVGDDFERNRVLVDLKLQPQDIQVMMFETVIEHAVPKTVSQVGLHLMKFCGEYSLQKIAEQIQSYAEPLAARYKQ